MKLIPTYYYGDVIQNINFVYGTGKWDIFPPENTPLLQWSSSTELQLWNYTRLTKEHNQ